MMLANAIWKEKETEMINIGIKNVSGFTCRSLSSKSHNFRIKGSSKFARCKISIQKSMGLLNFMINSLENVMKRKQKWKWKPCFNKALSLWTKLHVRVLSSHSAQSSVQSQGSWTSEQCGYPGKMKNKQTNKQTPNL